MFIVNFKDVIKSLEILCMAGPPTWCNCICVFCVCVFRICVSYLNWRLFALKDRRPGLSVSHSGYLGCRSWPVAITISDQRSTLFSFFLSFFLGGGESRQCFLPPGLRWWRGTGSNLGRLSLTVVSSKLDIKLFCSLTIDQCHSKLIIGISNSF